MVLTGLCSPFAIRVDGSAPGRRAWGIPPGGASDPYGAEYLRVTLGALHAVEVWAFQDVKIQVLESGTVGIWGNAFTWKARGFRLRTPLHLHLEAGSILEGQVHKPGAAALLGALGGLFAEDENHRSGCDRHRDTSHLEWVDPEPFELPCFPYAPLPTGRLRVATQRDRIGTRLLGDIAGRTAQGKSRLCTPGMIECPNAAELLIVGPDGPTMGGYPFLGCLSRLGRSRLARLPVGAEIVLRPTTFEAAVEEWADFHALLARHQARSGLE